jgi:MFS family permease
VVRDESAPAGNIAARIDRLPLTWMQWRLALITQLAWGVIIALDGMAARIYPYVWGPRHTFSPQAFSVLLAFQFGVGILAGEYLMGYLADRIGRRTAMILSALAVSLLTWPTALTDSFPVLLTFFSLGALGMGGVLAANVVYMTELAPPAIRGRINLGAQAFAYLTYVVLGNVPAIFLLPTYYKAYIYVLSALPLVLLLPFLIWGLPESPRWLEARGRRAEAEAVLTRLEDEVRRHTRSELPPPALAEYRVEATERVPVAEIFTGEYLRRTIILMVAWILGYAGIIYGFAGYAPYFLAAHQFPASLTFSVALINGIVGGVGGLLLGSWVGERLERRSLIFAAAWIFSVGCAVMYLWHAVVGLIIGTTIAVGAGTFWLFNMYNYTAAAYPTRLRSMGTGWTDGLGHVGSIFGPVVAGSLFTATASQGFDGWLLWVAVPGALIPSTLVYLLGIRQQRAILEHISA